MREKPQRIESHAVGRGHFRYFDYLLAAFVAILLLSNIIGASKPHHLGDAVADRLDAELG